jgi:hypothetical protein
MQHPPEKPTTDVAVGSTGNAAKPKRNTLAQKLRHLQRTSEGLAQVDRGPSRDSQHRQRKSDRPEPSLPPTPWDNVK